MSQVVCRVHLYLKKYGMFTFICSNIKGQIPLIGVGGILSGEQAAAKQQAGATLVQIYSGLIYTGPTLVKQCVEAMT